MPAAPAQVRRDLPDGEHRLDRVRCQPAHGRPHRSGVARSTARSKRRNTADRRSARSSATRSIRKVAVRALPRGGAGRAAGRGRRPAGWASVASRVQVERRPARQWLDRMAVHNNHGASDCPPRKPGGSSGRIASRGPRHAARGCARLLDLALPPLCPACREPVRRFGRPVCRLLVETAFIAPPYCERLGIPFAYDPGPGHPVDAGDRRSAGLCARAAAVRYRRRRARPGPRPQIWRPARRRAHAWPLDGQCGPRAAARTPMRWCRCRCTGGGCGRGGSTSRRRSP